MQQQSGTRVIKTLLELRSIDSQKQKQAIKEVTDLNDGIWLIEKERLKPRFKWADRLSKPQVCLLKRRVQLSKRVPDDLRGPDASWRSSRSEKYQTREW